MTATQFSAIVGRTSQDEAALDAGPADRLAAALDIADAPLREGDRLPHAWHWLHFLSAPRASLVGSDGRGAAGAFVPNFEGLNRMWAGGAFKFERPLLIGERVQRQSKITSVATKEGRSGRLVLSSIEQRLFGTSGLSVIEQQDLVFRERKQQTSGLDAGERVVAKSDWRRSLTPDEVLLFCFSALTYNSHRIHYDWRYTTLTEGYPGLLVHGPLTAILLLDAIRRNVTTRDLKSFDYRAVRPLFCNNPLTVCAAATADGVAIDVWAEDHQGFLAMRGRGEFR